MSSSPQTPGPRPLLRSWLVSGATVTAGFPLATLVRSPLQRAAHAASAGPDALGAWPMEQALSGLCAAALAVGYAAWTLGVLLTLAETSTGRAAALAELVPCPRMARSLAVVALGATLAVSGPATGDPPHHIGHSGSVGTPADALAGLALPDRVVTPRSPRTARTGTLHRVVVGDTLWAVARAALPSGCGDPVVARAWHRIASVNAEVVTDPDLIFPGTLLRVPPIDDLLGKDQT